MMTVMIITLMISGNDEDNGDDGHDKGPDFEAH